MKQRCSNAKTDPKLLRECGSRSIPLQISLFAWTIRDRLRSSYSLREPPLETRCNAYETLLRGAISLADKRIVGVALLNLNQRVGASC